MAMGVFRVSSGLLLFLTAGFACAQDVSCEPCGEGDRYSSAAALLERAGFSPEEYAVLVAWEERAGDGSGRYVDGLRIQPRSGGDPFDVYLGEGFRVLDEAELLALGISPKNWDLRPVDVETESASGVVRWAATQSPPRVRGIPPTGRVELAGIDLARVRAEDTEARLNKGARRIGVFQEIDPPIWVRGDQMSDGAWESTPDGFQVWSVSIYSPGARGQRVHFTELELPEGAQIVVYNAGSPSEAYGPYTRPAGDASLGLWTTTCFSDEAVVECSVPETADLGRIRIRVDRIIHVYTGFDELYWGKAAGDCNLDVTCYPDWVVEAKGVGGIGTIGYSGMLWCTGTLIADQDPSTQKPFFLTAYHCVNSQSEASTVEVYWLYQTSSCNGAPPDPASVPRTTGGADYLAGVSHTTGNDFALLRLKAAPPASIPFVGWTTAAPSVDDNIVPIHHPQGDFKRISFGWIYALDKNFIEVRYTAGTTENGSSGCPLFNAASKKIIGQLWGGDASCSNPGGYDKYGRFDVTYPIVAGYLLGDIDDPPVDPIPPCGSLSPVLYGPHAQRLPVWHPFAYGLTVGDAAVLAAGVCAVLITARMRARRRRVGAA